MTTRSIREITGYYAASIPTFNQLGICSHSDPIYDIHYIAAMGLYETAYIRYKDTFPEESYDVFLYVEILAKS